MQQEVAAYLQYLILNLRNISCIALGICMCMVLLLRNHQTACNLKCTYTKGFNEITNHKLCEWYGNSHSLPKSAGFNICIRLVYWIRSQGLQQNHSIRLRIVFMQTICGCLQYHTTKSTYMKIVQWSHSRLQYSPIASDVQTSSSFFSSVKPPPKTTTFKMRNEPNDAECQLKGISNIYIQILHHQPCIKDVKILNSKTLRTLKIMHMTNIYM